MSRKPWQPESALLYLDDEGVCYCGKHIAIAHRKQSRWSAIGTGPVVTRGASEFRCEETCCGVTEMRQSHGA